ncbi:replication endonuclease [Ewingella sp. S1.OA.A_B6]
MNPLNHESGAGHHKLRQWQQEQFSPGAPGDISLTERQLWHLDKTDHAWRAKYLAGMPDYLARYFGQRYTKLMEAGPQGRRRANTFLRTTVGKNVLPRLVKVRAQYATDFQGAGGVHIPFLKDLEKLPTYGRDEVRNLAHVIADFMAESFTDLIRTAFHEDAKTPEDMEFRTLATYRHLGELVKQVGVVPPYWQPFQAGQSFTVRHAESGLLRMMAPDWWRAKLKRIRDLLREHMAIAVGQVQKAASAYVSRSAQGEWVEQKKRNREFFKSRDAQNLATGERKSLTDMIDGSNANPAKRRCELMVRMRGFEDLADEMGMAGEFYTITAPSSYHAVHSKGGFVSQWNAASPRQTQKYLCGVWAKARAAFSRAGISVFGFRVVEPHHDGTPHWHMLLFMRPADVEQVRDILCYYARLEDSEELQSAKALKARFHVEPIDPEKGSATGYIAKYISKNIDGYALDGEADDETGENLKDMARAVSAWASRWRIRQFQQIGGAPVTVWRELRRMRDATLENKLMDAVLASADVGDWAAYTQAQGGALVKRRDLVVRLMYEITECGNEYAEDVQRVQGIYSPLVGRGSEVETRLVKWAIVPKLAASEAAAAFPGGPAAPWSSVNNCTQSTITALKKGFGIQHQDGDQMAKALLRGNIVRLDDESEMVLRDGELRLRPRRQYCRSCGDLLKSGASSFDKEGYCLACEDGEKHKICASKRDLDNTFSLLEI